MVHRWIGRAALAATVVAWLAGPAIAATPQEETVKAFNELIRHAKDGQAGYQLAAEKIQDPSLKTEFSKEAQKRQEFARTLQDRVMKLGGKPETDTSAVGDVHRGWMNIKSAITQGDKAILAEVIRGEEAAVKSYDEALTKGLPADARPVVQQQRDEIAKSLETARTHQSTHGG